MYTDPKGRIGKWIAAMLEYDLEIKPTKMIKGQGLEKLMAESNLHALDINLIVAMSEDEDDGSLIQVSEMFLQSPWYSDMVYVLQHLSPPPRMSRSKGEIHPISSTQHRWILTATDYFTKWIKAIPTRQATDTVIIKFLEYNILSRFGFPHKIITDNASEFKSKNMVEFCNKYNITLGHSTTYYLQGNELAESSNKYLVNIIKKMLETNKKNWH
eukprot:PITA_30239